MFWSAPFTSGAICSQAGATPYCTCEATPCYTCEATPYCTCEATPCYTCEATPYCTCEATPCYTCEATSYCTCEATPCYTCEATSYCTCEATSYCTCEATPCYTCESPTCGVRLCYTCEGKYPDAPVRRCICAGQAGKNSCDFNISEIFRTSDFLPIFDLLNISYNKYSDYGIHKKYACINGAGCWLFSRYPAGPGSSCAT
ncbi:hypothetical protein ESB13_15405 [Filimonas effusa]|uniref:Uncharacterized protein n=1 Tax=Filimonas effusa TaxID=2508721 RepID=A0A4Q1D4X7_9BACT|nr:hypothetical protein ESB13_15405 [Filimonas effusa]